MTQISRDDVQHLAQLSSLQLTDDELDNFAETISYILDHVESLSELDTEGVEPTYQVTGLSNIWRPDEVQHASVSREDLLDLAPESLNNQVKVPKVL